MEVRFERKRGCGFRKPGGLYLVAPGDAEPCCKLPLKLDVCPTCHAGVKPTRGWTWVDGDALLGHITCQDDYKDGRCPASRPMGRVGLLWVGEKFYPTPADFNREAADLGISRRIPALPKGFSLGETWVFLAHRKAVYLGHSGLASEYGGPEEHFYAPAIFRIFKPAAVEYVVRGDETPEQLQRLIDRGITPVKVVPAEEAEAA
ncbi:MAG: hypothetical protein QME75_10510 [Deltaproteobacteria bacterium]|nr:hypothetical protein [Deltaproteobacteria bacterium]